MHQIPCELHTLDCLPRVDGTGSTFIFHADSLKDKHQLHAAGFTNLSQVLFAHVLQEKLLQGVSTSSSMDLEGLGIVPKSGIGERVHWTREWTIPLFPFWSSSFQHFWYFFGLNIYSSTVGRCHSHLFLRNVKAAVNCPLRNGKGGGIGGEAERKP